MPCVVGTHTTIQKLRSSEMMDNDLWECKVANGEIAMLYVEALKKIEELENRLIEWESGQLEEALELLQEWHDLHCESNRTLDADDTYLRTQCFLINNSEEMGVTMHKFTADEILNIANLVGACFSHLNPDHKNIGHAIAEYVNAKIRELGTANLGYSTEKIKAAFERKYFSRKLTAGEWPHAEKLFHFDAFADGFKAALAESSATATENKE